MEEERAAAARAAAKECVRIILDGQAKEGGLETLNWQNKDGDTALIWAAEAGQAEIAQYLMEKGAPPHPPLPNFAPRRFPSISTKEDPRIFCTRWLVQFASEVGSKRR